MISGGPSVSRRLGPKFNLVKLHIRGTEHSSVGKASRSAACPPGFDSRLEQPGCSTGDFPLRGLNVCRCVLGVSCSVGASWINQAASPAFERAVGVGGQLHLRLSAVGVGAQSEFLNDVSVLLV